jgi:hypothetical protein
LAILLHNYRVDRYGATFPDAYAKIDRIIIDLSKEKALIEVRVYIDEDARAADVDGRSVLGIDKMAIEVPLGVTGVNVDSIKTACYNKLKSMTPFTSGADV